MGGYKMFLIQPFTVKPNGKVFDEVRNFFVNGEWAYAIYTDGTDDNAVYSLPEGHKYLDATRNIAKKAYKVFLEQAKWRGKSMMPPMTRFDVAVMPDPKKGPNALKVFINEIEMEAATWLVRYVPFDIVKRMSEIYPAKILELVEGCKRKSQRTPSDEAVTKLRALVDQIAVKTPTGATKRKAGETQAARKKRRGGA